MREDEKVTITLQKVKGLTAPVMKGQQIGYISYNVGNEEWKRINLVTTGEIDAIDMKWCLRQVFGKWMIQDKDKGKEKDVEKTKNLLGDYNNICYTKIDAISVAKKVIF